MESDSSDNSTLNKHDAPDTAALGDLNGIAGSLQRNPDAVVEDERKLSFAEAASLYPKAIAWSLFFSLGVIMCSFDSQLISVLFATPAFQRDFGYLYQGKYIVAAPWQTALSMGGPLGQVVGALFAAYPMEWYGRKKTFTACVVLTTACVFVQFFARSLPALLAGELIGGIILGSYVVIAPTYASEVCPLVLREVLTAFINLAFGIGQLLGTCVIAGTSRIDNHWAYSAAFAVQWVWPAIIFAGIPFAPESPWWLQRQNRFKEAEASLKRLASAKVDTKQALAVIIETDRFEREIEAGSTYADCFNKSNRRRTEIATGVYCIQILSGTYLVGYATYFFQLAGIPTASSFVVSIIFLLLGLLGTLIAFPMITHIPHRKIYLVCLAILALLQHLIGILDCLPAYTTHPAYAWAQAVLACVWNFVYALSIGPLCFVLLTSVSASRVRAKTVAFATSIQALLGIVMVVTFPYLFNPDQAGARGKVGFMFGGLAMVSWVWAWWRVPELKGRTCREVDVLFERGVKARDFAKTNVDDEDNSDGVADVGARNEDRFRHRRDLA